MKKLRFCISLLMMAVLAAVSAVPAYASGTVRVYSPYTGDDSNIGLLIALICISAAIVAGVLIYIRVMKKKAANEEKPEENKKDSE